MKEQPRDILTEVEDFIEEEEEDGKHRGPLSIKDVRLISEVARWQRLRMARLISSWRESDGFETVATKLEQRIIEDEWGDAQT